MKKTLLISLATLSSALFTFCEAQKWDSVGSGTNGSVNAMVANNGNLYVAGRFSKAGGIAASNIAIWNGSTWSALGTGVNGPIFSIAAYNGNIYVGGTFTKAGGNPANNIAEWNGTSWVSLGSGITVGSYGVYSLAVYNNKLIAGGVFTVAGGIPANNIASWDGSVWDTLSSGLRANPYGAVEALVAYDSVLYVGGYFDSAGRQPANNIAQWNGTNWATLGSGVNAEIYCAAINNHSLFVAGAFDTAGGNKVLGMAKWNGTNWNSVLTTAINGIPWVMLSYNGALIIGGSYDVDFSHTAYNVGFLNGTVVDSLGNSFAKDTGAYSLAVYNSELYAGGRIATSGGSQTNHIGRWTYPMGISTINENTGSINLFPNPNNGQFTIQIASGPVRMAGPGGQQLIANGSVEIYNMLGELIYSKPFTTNHSPLTIDMNNSPNGIYLYRVITETGSLVSDGKFVVQK